jgi:RNA polymerase sigma factor (sigma-70 family)
LSVLESTPAHPVHPLHTAARRALDGDAAGWTALMDSASGTISRITAAHRLSDADAADVRQFVWMRMLEHPSAVRSPGRLAGWVATVTRDECNRLVRRHTREVSTCVREMASALVEPEDAEAPVLRTESGALLWTAVRQVLKERDFTLIRMTMADPPASYAQVARCLDIPVGSIGPTRQRCLAQLRAHLSRPEWRELAAL